MEDDVTPRKRILAVFDSPSISRLSLHDLTSWELEVLSTGYFAVGGCIFK